MAVLDDIDLPIRNPMAQCPRADAQDLRRFNDREQCVDGHDVPLPLDQRCAAGGTTVPRGPIPDRRGVGAAALIPRQSYDKPTVVSNVNYKSDP